MVTLNDIEQIIYQNGFLFIPLCIETSIIKIVENSIDHGSTIDSIKVAGQKLSSDYTKTYDGPIRPDYNNIETVDAYTLFYTRRNTLIPRIILRDILLNPYFQNIPAEIRVLDIGSGTGAITMGFLEIFTHPPLTHSKVHVEIIDQTAIMLRRQRELLTAAQLSPQSINNITCDLTNSADIVKNLKGHGEYDFIFAANVFTELSNTEAITLLQYIAQHLAEKGIIAIVDAQRNHMKRMLPVLVYAASQLGLTTYYPCPPNKSGTCGECWYWRQYTYKCNDIIVKGQLIDGPFREQLLATWLVLSKSKCTIYDHFISAYQNLEWGPISPYGQNSQICESQVCTTTGQKYHVRVGQSMNRGSIVGGTGNPFKVTQYQEL